MVETGVEELKMIERTVYPVAMFAILAFLLLAGCREGTVRQQSTLPTDEIAASGEGVLGPLDVVHVRVYDEPEITGDYRVDADGTINFPFLKAVEVTGLTPGQAALRLAEMLSAGYLVDPAVSVYVKESNSRRVIVQGYVKTPGPVPFRDGMTVVEAVAMAGGVVEDGALNRISVMRQTAGEEHQFYVKLSAIYAGREPDVPIQPGDIIFVPRSPI
jgi:protein involved in polysaccharide export with SLBB domain